MSDASKDTSTDNDDPGGSDHDPDLQSRFPTAYTILFLLIIFVAALTWIVPAGEYEREMKRGGRPRGRRA